MIIHDYNLRYSSIFRRKKKYEFEDLGEENHHLCLKKVSFRSKTLTIIIHTEDKNILNIINVLQKARYISISEGANNINSNKVMKHKYDTDITNDVV